MKFVENLLIYR